MYVGNITYMSSKHGRIKSKKSHEYKDLHGSFQIVLHHGY